MIHHANNLRPKRDGLKVGGHQASSASLVTVLTALYTKVLRPQDRVAVKPHASPAFHAIQYLFENQTLEQLQKFRSLGGIQSYPSRTKDQCEVDLSTGSVGLGATMATFLAHVEAFLRGKDLNPPAFPGTSVPPELSARTIGIVGDAELDEGSVFEGLLESWKLDIRNNWYIVDYNRQSLDKIMEENSFRLIDRLFRMNGFDVVSVKYVRVLVLHFLLKNHSYTQIRSTTTGHFSERTRWKNITTILERVRQCKVLCIDVLRGKCVS